eukprot:15481907-Alexandrium_andersonii.AAC.1
MPAPVARASAFLPPSGLGGLPCVAAVCSACPCFPMLPATVGTLGGSPPRASGLGGSVFGSVGSPFLSIALS